VQAKDSLSSSQKEEPFIIFAILGILMIGAAFFLKRRAPKN